MRSKDVQAPFTPEQVATLNRFQAGGWFHPFTCGRRSQHREDEGVLIAAVEGWACPVERCEYVQQWAHWFMADPVFVERGEKNHRRMWSGLTNGDSDDDSTG